MGVRLRPEPFEFPVDPFFREPLRMRSKALFGNRDRLEVAVAIAQASDGVVNAADLSLELLLANNRVRAQLIAFCEAGLLDPAPSDAGKRWYLRREHPFWQACRNLFEEWALELQRSPEIIRRR